MDHVLVVDDDPGIQGLLTAILEDDGYQVMVAADGQTACEVTKRQHPRVVLMDLRLPVMDGVTAIRRLKQDPATAHIPIIAFSAERGLLSTAAQFADDAVAKPFELDDMLTRVQRLYTAASERPQARGAEANGLTG